MLLVSSSALRALFREDLKPISNFRAFLRDNNESQTVLLCLAKQAIIILFKCKQTHLLWFDSSRWFCAPSLKIDEKRGGCQIRHVSRIWVAVLTHIHPHTHACAHTHIPTWTFYKNSVFRFQMSYKTFLSCFLEKTVVTITKLLL